MTTTTKHTIRDILAEEYQKRTARKAIKLTGHIKSKPNKHRMKTMPFDLGSFRSDRTYHATGYERICVWYPADCHGIKHRHISFQNEYDYGTGKTFWF